MFRSLVLGYCERGRATREALHVPGVSPAQSSGAAHQAAQGERVPAEYVRGHPVPGAWPGHTTTHNPVNGTETRDL